MGLDGAGCSQTLKGGASAAESGRGAGRVRTKASVVALRFVQSLLYHSFEIILATSI